MAQGKPVLYSYFRSSCSWRVRIALALKRIDYEYRAVDLLRGEHRSPEFRALNPAEEVPVLVLPDGAAVTQSLAILEYLEETGGAPLLPGAPLARARVHAVVDGIQPLQTMRVLQFVGGDAEAWGRHWIERGFRCLEAQLRGTRGRYCVGDSVTLADVCLVPQVYNAARFQVDMAPFPRIAEIAARLSALEAFAASRPAAMPDCPPDCR